MKSRE